VAFICRIKNFSGESCNSGGRLDIGSGDQER